MELKEWKDKTRSITAHRVVVCIVNKKPRGLVLCLTRWKTMTT